MLRLRAVYEFRWAGPIGIVVGIAVIVTGMTIRGDTGSDLRDSGTVLTLAALFECGIRATAVLAYSTGYRRGRRVARPVVLTVPRQDERFRAMAEQHR